MISQKGEKLVSDLMMTIGGDPVEWKQNYDNLIKFIEELEKRVIDAGWEASARHSQATGVGNEFD